jgi:hypothetical protein
MYLTKLIFFSFALSFSYAAERSQGVVVPAKVQSLLSQYCTDCHGAKKKKGDVRLHDISAIGKSFQSDLLNKIEQQLYTEDMPPKDEDQLKPEERQLLFSWLNSQYQRLGEKSKFQEKLKSPAYGNYMDHEKLFSGKYRNLKGFTHDRRWVISEYIFDAKINHMVNHSKTRTIDGARQTVVGDNGANVSSKFGGGSLRQSISNPFLLPKHSGVRYYDNTPLTGGHLLSMISNAKKISGHMTSESVMKAHYPVMYKMMEVELGHDRIVRSRQQFLDNYIKTVVQNLYKDKNEALLPRFVSLNVADIPETLKNGKVRREKNIGLLHRNDKIDVQAIYRGLAKYKKEGVSYDQVVDICEKEWFYEGVYTKRLRRRLELMKSIKTQYVIEAVYKDIKNKNKPLATYKALSKTEMKTINTAILKHRKKGDTYMQIVEKCLEGWKQSFKAERDAASSFDDQLVTALVHEVFTKVYQRPATTLEVAEGLTLIKVYIEKLGNQKAIAKLIETVILSSEFTTRFEFGVGKADAHSRKMLSPRDASYALAYALTDTMPDKGLVAAVANGKLSTKEDYQREVKRLLKRRDQFYIIDETVQKAGFNSSITNLPIRKLRFFRDFFAYTKAMTLFKDEERFGGKYNSAIGRLVDEADMLVEHILKNDQKVFEELLTTEKFYVFHSGDNKAMKEASDKIRTIYDYFKDKGWKDFTEEQLYKHWPFIDKMKMRGTRFSNFLQSKRKTGWVRSFKTMMTSFEFRLGKGQKAPAPYNSFPQHYSHKGNASTRAGQQMRGPEVGKFFGIDFANWDYPTTQPAKVPNRKGMLTHPAWLIAHAQNTETDPVRRGKWVREKLLAGTISDLPINVEAQIPEDHHKTLRSRLKDVTEKKYCWKCHEGMNPLGLTFEIYDDFGLYRTKESLEHADNLISKYDNKKRALHMDSRAVYKTLPVDSKGYLAGTDDKKLDGELKDAMDLADRLGKSSRVRQSIIRHAFRYFIGRNEVLSDSKTLMDADEAYTKSGGSFDAVIVSLLTSDSFIYRKKVKE